MHGTSTSNLQNSHGLVNVTSTQKLRHLNVGIHFPKHIRQDDEIKGNNGMLVQRYMKLNELDKIWQEESTMMNAHRPLK